jgi:hypothetical protein
LSFSMAWQESLNNRIVRQEDSLRETCVASFILITKKNCRKRKERKLFFSFSSSLCINTYLPGVFEQTTNILNLIKDSKAIWIHFSFLLVRKGAVFQFVEVWRKRGRFRFWSERCFEGLNGLLKDRVLKF